MFLYWSNWENVFKYNKKTKHLSQILAKNFCSFSFSHVPSLIFLAKIFFPCRHQWSHGTGGLVFFQVALEESPSFTWRLCFCFLAPEQLFCCLLIEKRRVYVQIREPSPSPADGRHVECVSMPPPERSLAHRSLRFNKPSPRKSGVDDRHWMWLQNYNFDTFLVHSVRSQDNPLLLTQNAANLFII